MYTDTTMAWNVEPYDAMQPIWAICVRNVTPGCSLILNCVGSVLQVSQGRVAVNIIISGPCTDNYSTIADE